jgi:alcohol dehydrogenase, propanol-preferring
MVLEAPGGPLVLRKRPVPVPGPGEVRIEVAACGVCRPDVHLLAGELPDIPYPIVPARQVVGRVAAWGPEVGAPALGPRVGLAWLGAACGACAYCRKARENLCDGAGFTGYRRDGGDATHCLADAPHRCYARASSAIARCAFAGRHGALACTASAPPRT